MSKMPPTQFPRKLEPLFVSARYKVVHGGRGGGKSWAFARALLLKGMQRKMRILCTREVQKSIKDSVHRLISDQIKLLGLENVYEVLATEIRNKKNGSEFIFAGLGEMTVDSIKSYEGCDVVWVEEGQTIRDRSWQILIPTIRKETFNRRKYNELREMAETDPDACMEVIEDAFGFDEAPRIFDDLKNGLSTEEVKSLASDPSEIWVSFNPELDSDSTYERFITNTPGDAIVIEMNWRDNPWFNRTMDRERRDAKKNDPKNYDWIWEGKTKPAVEGAIFYEELQAMIKEGRIRNVPYDPMLRVHIVVDLGFGHAMCIALVQVCGPAINVIWYKEFFNEKLSDMAATLKTSFPKYNWGKVWLPYADGFSKSRNGQDSAYQIFKAAGFLPCTKEEVSAITGKEQGITITKERFSRFYWDKENCADLIEAARRYRRSINKVTLVAGAPLNDQYADGGDTIRYIGINANSMDNAIDDIGMPDPSMVADYHTPLDEAVGY